MLLVQACAVSTASLGDAKICESLQDNECTEDKQIIPPTATSIYMSAQLNDAPEGTEVTYTVTDTESNVILESDTFTTEEGGSGPITISLNKPAGGWVTGLYEIRLELATDNSEPITKTFEIK